MLKSAGEIFLSGLRGAKIFSVAFRIVFRIFFAFFKPFFVSIYKFIAGSFVLETCRPKKMGTNYKHPPPRFYWAFPSDGSRRYGLSIHTTSRGAQAQMPLKQGSNHLQRLMSRRCPFSNKTNPHLQIPGRRIDPRKWGKPPQKNSGKLGSAKTDPVRFKWGFG